MKEQKIAVKNWIEVYTRFQAENKSLRKSPNTLAFHAWGAGGFAKWLDSTIPDEPGRPPVPVTGLELVHVTAFINEQQDSRKLSDRTIHSYYLSIRAMWYWATGHPDNKTGGILPYDLWFKIKASQEPDDNPFQVLDDDWERILAALDTGLTPERDKALVFLAMDSGIRRIEIARLKWRDITWNHKENTGRVRIELGKGDKFRTTVFGPKAYAALLVWKTKVDGWYDPKKYPRLPVFPSVSRARERAWVKWCREGQKGKQPNPLVAGVPMNAASIGAIFVRLTKRAGADVRCHALRHFAARDWMANGASPSAIQTMLGHKELSTTDRYLKLTSAQAEAEVLKALHKAQPT